MTGVESMRGKQASAHVNHIAPVAADDVLGAVGFALDLRKS